MIYRCFGCGKDIDREIKSPEELKAFFRGDFDYCNEECEKEFDNELDKFMKNAKDN